MIPKALILDRDGTLIAHVPYLSNPDEMVFLPGVVEGLEIARETGVKLFLHTNQSGVGRGMFSMDDVGACNDRLNEMLGYGFEKVCIAPEAPGEPSKYRKPSAEFAKEVMGEFGFSEEEICYVGDRGSDIAAAEAAGTRGVGVHTGLDDLPAELEALGLSGKYPVFPDFLSAIEFLFPKS
ncbi:MAG: D-glycero-alpha-D-manno-heptose-1,7-bisphosphate 7-phosphatase [Luteolibacter sp.]